MSKLQKILFPIVILAIIVLIILTWGSIASGAFALALVMSGPVYLFNRFINVDRENDFQSDDTY